MVWLRMPVNFSTKTGQDSPNRPACETKNVPNAVMMIKTKSRVMTIAATRLIFLRTKKSTTG